MNYEPNIERKNDKEYKFFITFLWFRFSQLCFLGYCIGNAAAKNYVYKISGGHKLLFVPTLKRPASDTNQPEKQTNKVYDVLYV